MDESADRLALRDLVDRYSTAVTLGDVAAIAAVYAEDAEWRVDPPFGICLRGREAIAEGLRGMLAAQAFIVQMVHSAVIDLDGDRARLRCVVQEVGRAADGTSGMTMYGLYEDEARKRDGRWLFTRRRFRPLLLDTAAPPGTAFERAD